MERTLIDNEWLAVELPEGFEPVPHDELAALMSVSHDCMWGVRDTTRHMLINVTWKDSNKLITKAVSEKTFAKNVNQTFTRCYRKGDYRNGDNRTGYYHCDGFFQRTVSGASAQAHGFRFSYMVEGIDQEGEVLVFKRGIRCYTLCYYTRSATAQDNQPVYEGIVKSLEVLS